MELDTKMASFDVNVIRRELLKRVYHLRTLCDMSKDLFRTKDKNEILGNFLLMTMGSFGVDRGFVLTQFSSSGEVDDFVAKGFHPEDEPLMLEAGSRFWEAGTERTGILDGAEFNSGMQGFLKIALPFSVDEELQGIIGMGPKILNQPFSEDEKELLSTLANNLVGALGNLRSFVTIERLNTDLKEKTQKLEQALFDLDLKVYHLKTLYDVSKDIFSSVDSRAIMRSFLLMTMGNFAVTRGFLALRDFSEETVQTEFAGYEEEDADSIVELLNRFSSEQHLKGGVITDKARLPSTVDCGLAFRVDEDCAGFLGLGPKLLEISFREHDKELLSTLVNNLIIALRNAKAFEEIQRLNLDLREALRKVELLESIKANLCKFVPTTVSRLIEKSPTEEVLEAQEKDISVLFLDIEGYTKITERIGAMAVNTLVEKYFSVFMEAIYANNGDVVETAGDGLMVLFMNDEKHVHAVEAARAAVTIQENTDRINRESSDGSEQVIINLGVCSGPAMVGAARFDSLTGSRWTYTSHGNTTNIAARICSLAKRGQLLVAKSTAERIKDCFCCQSLGNFSLKNVSEQLEIFLVRGPQTAKTF